MLGLKYNKRDNDLDRRNLGEYQMYTTPQHEGLHLYGKSPAEAGEAGKKAGHDGY